MQLHRTLVAAFSATLLALPLGACGDDDDDRRADSGDATDAGETGDTTPTGINIAPASATTVAPGATAQYTITGLDDAQAYRITLVVAANVTVSGDMGVFVDGDSNGAADAGASENVALITSVNGTAQAGAKTVPAGTDDPSDPSGVFPSNGQITLTVTGEGAGTVYPVVYENGGASTFLEIDAGGVPTEEYAVGGPLTVTGAIAFDPAAASNLEAGDTLDVTISGLDDSQAYRVTLVVAGNVTVTGAQGVFVDGDSNGAADAGASENVALITRVNGVAQTGAKTVPAGTDDPSSPTGVFPSGGEITMTITAQGSGTVYPVAYHNGGASTFLEIDSAGVPTETYAVGGAIAVAGTPTFAPSTAQDTTIGGTVDVTIGGLDDTQAYRVTLVVGGNVTVTGDDGVFVDGDSNGAADAGASENVALITSVNGTAQTGAKTIPGGTDDPMNPSGVFPSGGEITLTITGAGAGTVYPVAYENGGASTFLEIDSAGVPTEVYAVGGAINVADDPTFAPSAAQDLMVGDTADLTISGLDDTQAYRITLVVGGNVTPTGDAGVFVDGDSNGAADAGASENVALITSVNGAAQTGAKTVPAGTDDPSDPTGIFPVDGVITLTVTAVGAGSVYPVVYHNGGTSTFLEIDGSGVPTETYAVGGELAVADDPTFAQTLPQATVTGGDVALTINGLDDAQAYRITLVVGGNVTVSGDEGTFVDGDSNGAADAGASENIALITSVNGTTQTGAKTVPAGTDDPMNPTGVFPVGGQITLVVTGVGAGTIYPVVYHNGGASTFLEIDSSGVPTETHSVGPSVTVAL